MGTRPPDFDEKLIKQSPTYVKWAKLLDGQKLRYACRDFVKGHAEDEERLMRRIMIARRNNLRDHEILKNARKKKFQDMVTEEIQEDGKEGEKDGEVGKAEAEVFPSPPKKRRNTQSYTMTDDEVLREMDIPAVEGTRSYKTWLSLPDGQEFTYNQKYQKGKEGHDWLLKKNIWRRMRYRRENKKMVDKLKNEKPENLHFRSTRVDSNVDSKPKAALESAAAAATQIVDHALLTTANGSASANAGASTDHDNTIKPKVEADLHENTPPPPPLPSSGQETFVHDAVVEAAVAAANSFVQKARESDDVDTPATNTDTMSTTTSTKEKEERRSSVLIGDVNSATVAAAAAVLAVSGKSSDEVSNNNGTNSNVTTATSTAAATVASIVHNPIISTGSLQDEGDATPSQNKSQSTPNPLLLDGHTLDVAAKLAASALSAAEDHITTKTESSPKAEDTNNDIIGI